MLGAIERAAYDLGLAEPDTYAFRTSAPSKSGLGYKLGEELSLKTYSIETRQASPDSLNDHKGYEAVISLLDDYIAEVKAGRPREAS